MKLIRFAAASLLALLILTGCDQPAPSEGAEMNTAPVDITAVELRERIAADNAPMIIDVRTAEEFAAGHIEGAVNVTHTDLGAQGSSLPAEPDAEIVVYCQRGGRAIAAQATLTELGFSNVRHLDGDFAGWQSAPAAPE